MPQSVSARSRGEKSRLVLAELLTGRPNLMILDEPTNHMDIPAKETLESAFKAYTGTMLFVSHDRYFIKQVADAILVFENDKVMYYPFGYDHYISRLKASKDGNPAGTHAGKGCCDGSRHLRLSQRGSDMRPDSFQQKRRT